MVRNRAILFLCAWLFWDGHCGAADDLQRISEILARADVLASRFQGEFELYGAEEKGDTPLDFRLDGLTLRAKGRLWVVPHNVLAEFLGGTEIASVGTGSRFNDILEVIAVSDDACFDFLPIGSTLAPTANLRVYTPDTAQELRTRIKLNVLDYLNAAATLGGLDVVSFLAERRCVIRTDLAKGHYSIYDEEHNAKNPSTISYELTVNANDVKCKSNIAVGAPPASMTIETIVDAELVDGTIIPRRVARKSSGPGNGIGRRDVMQFVRKDLGDVKFPITSDYFRKYEREYGVLRGNAVQTNEIVNAVPEKFRQPMSIRLGPETTTRFSSRFGMRSLIFVAVNLIIGTILLARWFFLRRQR